jgi:hypothetical protein
MTDGCLEGCVVFIRQEIDRIVEAFIPEMTKVWEAPQSEAQKERQTKAWLRATLQKFADDIVASEQGRSPAGRGARPKLR